MDITGWIPIPSSEYRPGIQDWEQFQAGMRAKLQAQRYRRLIEALPPECSRAEIRKYRRVTQEQLALRMGLRQARISRIERITNPRLLLLDTYIQALGGKLHLQARFIDKDFRIRL